MKKIMIAFTVAAMAVAANAAKVNWGVQTGQALDTSKVDSGTMYLVYSGAAAPDWSKLDGLDSFDASTITSTLGATIVDSTAYGSGTVNAFTVVKPTTPVSGLGGGLKTFYTVVIDGDGKDLAYTASGSPVTIANNEQAAGATQLASNFTYVSAGSTPTPIPEPTSGLLMLLGVAGLALRRRRA